MDRKELVHKKTKALNQLNQIKNEIYNLDRNYSTNNYDNIGSKTKINYICPCPEQDCKGLIKSSTFKCSICDKSVCRKCREPRTENHECNQDIINNLKSIRKNTKPCPNCAVAIHKIIGCPQMFCTACKTPFSWDTLKILQNKNLHNPHAIEFMRTNTGFNHRNIGDVACGGLPRLDIYREQCNRFILEKYVTMNLNISKLKKYINNYIDRKMNPRNIYRYNGLNQNEINEYEVPCNELHIIYSIYQRIAEINGSLRQFVNNNNKIDNIRYDYLLSIIEEEKWKQKIFLIERQNEKKDIMRMILSTFQTLGIERIINFTQSTDYDISILDKFVKEMNKLRDYINNTIKEELTIWGAKKFFQFSNEWKYVKIK